MKKLEVSNYNSLLPLQAYKYRLKAIFPEENKN